MMSIGYIISQMAKVLTNQYLNRTDCSPVVLNPLPNIPLIKGLHPVASTRSGPPFSLQQSFRVWPKSGPRRLCPEVCLQDMSDPASVPKDSLAPLKHEAAHLHRMGFPWQLDLSICSLSGLESLTVLFLIRVWKTESFLLPTLPLYF